MSGSSRIQPLVRPLLLVAGLFGALEPRLAQAEEVECSSEWGSCEVSNDTFDFVTCSCESEDSIGGSDEGTGGDEWKDMTSEELMEVCEDHLDGCNPGDSGTTGDDDGWLTCENELGKCRISNDPHDFISCSCDDGSGTGGSGGDEWSSLTDEELLEICEESLSWCHDSDDVTTGPDSATSTTSPGTTTASSTNDTGSNDDADVTTDPSSEDDTGESDVTTDSGDPTTSGGVEAGSGEDGPGDSTSTTSGGDSADTANESSSAGGTESNDNSGADDSSPTETSDSQAGDTDDDPTSTDTGDPASDGLPGKGCQLAEPSVPWLWALLLPGLSLLRRRR